MFTQHYPLALEIQNLEQAADRFSERKGYLSEISQTLDTVLIGGTLTEKTSDGYYNTCYVFDRGQRSRILQKSKSNFARTICWRTSLEMNLRFLK